MIRMIFHQIWNQRRQNLWIWLELAVLSAFLWIVMDPLFTMVCLQRIPCGFDRDSIYIIYPIYGPSGQDVLTVRNDRGFISRMDNLLTRLEAHPMVEAVCLGSNGHIPGGRSMSMSSFYCNLAKAKEDDDKAWEQQTNRTSAQWFIIPCITGLEKWTDMPYTLGLRDAISGEYIHARQDALMQKLTYVSAKMATSLYGTSNVRDSTVFSNDQEDPSLGTPTVERGQLRRIDAVYADVKVFDYRAPTPSLFRLQRCDDARVYTYGALVRLKDGVDGATFMETIRRDVLRDFSTAPVKQFEIVSLEQQMGRLSETAGANNVVRLQSALGFFGLLCVFLGISGLFWVRCGERRQDMGVMRSLGATRRAVGRQMLMEATLLLTAAFLAAMVFVAWYVHTYGYDVGLNVHFSSGNTDLSYWFLRPWPHVLSVTAITYALMLLITLLATWVPVHRATRILPGDALRDE